jgi:thiamine pyrophosphate-dependent acetolactate synthase large subunit-like protein
MMTKMEAATAFRRVFGPEVLVVCCNGMIGRELYTAADAPSTFYMIGSMGLALSIGLGLALAQPKRKVVVLDGDGNVLMGLNALASVASERPPNLTHVVLDNHAHASTGGQRTISGEIPLESVAGALGYRATHRCETATDFEAALKATTRQPGPVMVLGVVAGGTTKGIGRVEPSPPELAARFAAEARRPAETSSPVGGS